MEQEYARVKVVVDHDLCWSFALFGIVGPSEVPPQLIGMDLFKEITAVSERFEVEQFDFDASVRAFDIAMGVGRGRRQEAMGDAPGLDFSVETVTPYGTFGAAVFGAVVGRENA